MIESFLPELSSFMRWLVVSTSQASVLICLILAVKVLLRNRLPARWHYWLWLLLIVRMVMPWAPPSSISVFNLTSSVRETARETPITKQITQARPQSPAIERPAITKEMPPVRESVGAELPKAKPIPTGPANLATETPPFDIMEVISWLWLTVVTAVGIVAIAYNLKFWKIIRSQRPLTEGTILDLFEDCKAELAIQTIIGVVVTDKVESPALFGVIRPRLLLPKGILQKLDRDQLRYVFLHELAHHKRHDIYLGWLMVILQLLHWFNPLIWFAFARMRSDRELACDGLVLEIMGPDNSHAYGQTLVDLFKGFSQIQFVPGIAGILENKSRLKRRITMIARFKRISYRWSILMVVLMAVLAFVTLTDGQMVTGKLRFEDNFNDGNANGWEEYDGVFSVVSGAYRVVSTASWNDARSVAGDPDWTDYVIDLDFNNQTMGNAACVLFRVQEIASGTDAGRYYQLHMYPDKVGFAEMDYSKGNAKLLAEVPYTVSSKRWHHLQISIKGTRAIAFIDGEYVLSYDGFEKYTWGRMGLKIINGGVVLFDKVIVSDAFSYHVDGAGGDKDDVGSFAARLEPALVAWWKFDESSGSIAHDSAGNNDGTLVNGPVWTTGRIDGALRFDGVDDYVEIPRNENLDNVAENFTILLWAQPLSTHEIDSETNDGVNGASGQKHAIGPEHGDDRWGSGHAGAGISIGTNGISVYEHAVNYLPPLLVWPGSVNGITHVAVVYSNNQPRLYVNGELKKTGLKSSKTVHIRPNYIGGHFYDYFNGLIDDIRIYDRPLSAGEIEQLYSERTGLVAHWKLDEGEGTTAYDSAGINHGTLINGPVWTTGQIEGALSFDGVEDRVVMGDKSELEGFSELSIAAWIYWTGPGDYDFIAGKEEVYKIDVDKSHIRFLTGNNWAGTILTSSEAIQQNAWYHIAATYDGAKKHVYINGIKDGQSVSTSGSVGTNSMQFTVGVLTDAPGGWYNYFKGRIDDVRIYDRALSADEVGQLYRVTGGTTESVRTKHTGPVARWSFDEGSGSIAHDSVGDNDGTLINGPVWTTGQIGGAMRFDGVDDYVDCGKDESLNVTELTWSLWIKRTETTYSNERALISNTGPKTDAEESRGTYALQIDEGGQYQDKIQFVRHGIPVQQCPLSNTAITDMDWHHIAVTRYINGNVTIYIDGYEDATGHLPERTAYDKTFIGTGHTSYSNFDGTIDDVRIYDRALSAGEIEQLYSQGTGLVAHWKLDEGEGTTAYDSAGTNHGILVNGPVWTTGKVDGAIRFDGSNDCVSIPDSSVFDFGMRDFSMSVWFKAYKEKTSFIVNFRQNDNEPHIEIYTYGHQKRSLGTHVLPEDDRIEGGAIELDRWHHAVITMVNGDNGGYKLYFDGQLKGQKTFKSSLKGWDTITIGAQKSDGDRFFNGAIDDIRIYNRALSADEVGRLHRMASSRATKSAKTGPVGHWSFDNDDGDTVIDSSTNANHGKLKTTVKETAVTKWASQANVSMLLNDAERFVKQMAQAKEKQDYSSVDIGAQKLWYILSKLRPTIPQGIPHRVFDRGRDIPAVRGLQDYSEKVPELVDCISRLERLCDDLHSAIRDQKMSVVSEIYREFNKQWTIFNSITKTDPAGGKIGPTLTEGISGKAYYFDGMGDCIEVPDDSSLDITSTLTVSVWAKTESINRRQVIVAKNAPGHNSWILEVNTDDFGGTKFNFYIDLFGFDGNFGSNTAVAVNEWCHVAGTYNGSERRIYINGKLDANQTISGPIPKNDQPVRIGTYADSARSFKGAIDNVYIYNRALSAEEIRQLYEQGSN